MDDLGFDIDEKFRIILKKNCKLCGGSYDFPVGKEKGCANCGLIKRKKEIQGRDRTRELVRKRDNFTCQDCKKVWEIGMRRFDVHHLNGLCGKKSRGYDKVSDMKGLITLCHKCHFNRPEHAQRKREKSLSTGGYFLFKMK